MLMRRMLSPVAANYSSSTVLNFPHRDNALLEPIVVICFGLFSICVQIIFGGSGFTAPGFLSSKSTHLLSIRIFICLIMKYIAEPRI